MNKNNKSKHLYKKYKSKYLKLKKMSGGSLLDDKKLVEILDSFDETDSFGGLLISHNNELVYEKYYNNTTNSQFRIFSCTKPICGLAIMILIDQNKLSIDDTINKFFINIPNSDKITVWHLLDCESGMFDVVASVNFQRKPIEYFDFIYKPGADKTEFLWFEQYTELCNQNKPDFEPGEDWTYNSAGYDVLGYIIYLVSGMKTTDFIQKYIFGPLGMSDSTFHKYQLHDEVLPYESHDQIGVKEDVNFFGTEGNIITTLRDYNKFLNGYDKLLSSFTLGLYQRLYYFTKNFKKESNTKIKNIFFLNYINDVTHPTKSNIFWHMGAGDFTHDFGLNGSKAGALSKTIMIRFLDKNLNLIISQNYEGTKKKLFAKQRFNFIDLDNLTNTEQLIRYLANY